MAADRAGFRNDACLSDARMTQTVAMAGDFSQANEQPCGDRKPAVLAGPSSKELVRCGAPGRMCWLSTRKPARIDELRQVDPAIEAGARLPGEEALRAAGVLELDSRVIGNQ